MFNSGTMTTLSENTQEMSGLLGAMKADLAYVSRLFWKVKTVYEYTSLAEKGISLVASLSGEAERIETLLPLPSEWEKVCSSRYIPAISPTGRFLPKGPLHLGNLETLHKRLQAICEDLPEVEDAGVEVLRRSAPLYIHGIQAMLEKLCKLMKSILSDIHEAKITVEPLKPPRIGV